MSVAELCDECRAKMAPADVAKIDAVGQLTHELRRIADCFTRYSTEMPDFTNDN